MCPPFTYFYLWSFVDLKTQVSSDQWKMIVVGFMWSQLNLHLELYYCFFILVWGIGVTEKYWLYIFIGMCTLLYKEEYI